VEGISIGYDAQGELMQDAIFVLAVLIFFAVSIFYVYGCERLK
jgi:hypothetical protein